MKSATIYSRSDFKNIYDILSECVFDNASLNFRELAYYLKKKIKELIIDREADLFKSPDKGKQEEMEKARFEAAKKFALKDAKGEIIYKNTAKTSFNFDPKQQEAAIAFLEKWDTEGEFKDLIASNKKREEEHKEWLDKKIQIMLEKSKRSADIPKISNPPNKPTMFNLNVAYDLLRDCFCIEEETKIDPEDGKEIE